MWHVTWTDGCSRWKSFSVHNYKKTQNPASFKVFNWNSSAKNVTGKARQGQNVMSRTVVKQDVRCFAHFKKWVTCKLYSWYTFLIIVLLITATVTWQVEFLIFSIYVHCNWTLVSLGCDKRSIALFFRFGPDFRVPYYVFPNRVFIYIYKIVLFNLHVLLKYTVLKSEGW